MLNPKSRVPLYHQLAEILEERIRSGAYRPGDSIPTETQLAGEFELGRPTVRQATEQLVKKSLVERRRGSGTFVCDAKVEVELFSKAGLKASFAKSGLEIETSVVLAPLQVQSQHLNCPSLRVGRLVQVKGESVLFETLELAMKEFSGIEDRLQEPF
ncbi:MAG: GntR family transcriptional regulator, partial [Polyangiaceae bacterium]|nr:GntR family transcriptional regulator [Polyangiaceae bacterium]